MKVIVNDELIECLRGYGADAVIAVECEYDYPHVILVHIKEGRIIHYMPERDLSVKRRKHGFRT